MKLRRNGEDSRRPSNITLPRFKGLAESFTPEVALNAVTTGPRRMPQGSAMPAKKEAPVLLSEPQKALFALSRQRGKVLKDFEAWPVDAHGRSICQIPHNVGSLDPSLRHENANVSNEGQTGPAAFVIKPGEKHLVLGCGS
jgi:hypothetical protein